MKKIINRNFILVFLGQLALSFGFHILIPTLPIYLSRLGSPETEIGILIGIFSVSSLVIRPFVGRALLKTPERNFMITGAFLFALTSITYLIASPFWPFLMVRVFQGMGLAFFNTASITLIANISPEAHRGQSLSYFYLAFNIAFALAPVFGMFIINHFNFTLLFLFCTGLSLCSLFITTKLGKKQVNSLEDSSIDDGSFFSRKALPPAIMVFFAHIIWGALTAFFPLYALNHGVNNPGFFFTAYAVVLILGRVLGGRILDLYSRERVMLPCLTTYIISMIILAFSKTLPMFILVAVIWGIGNAFLIPTLVAYTIELSGSSRGPAMGTFTAFADLGTGLGPMIAGFILRFSSYQAMFLFLALTGGINLYYFYVLVWDKGKRLKKSP
jgi:MFS family permease